MNAVLARFDIQFTDGQTTYNEGEAVQGHVIINLKDDLVIENLTIEFCGIATVQWVKARRPVLHSLTSPSSQRAAGSSKLKQPNTTKEEERYLNQVITLYARGRDAQSDMMVAAGQHEYGFQIQLPYNIPSSFTGDHGAVKYYALATLERPWHPKVTVSKDFSLVNIVDLSAMSLQPVNCHKGKNGGVLCCLGGGIALTYRLERTAFIPGERIKINSEIHNNSRTKIKKSKAALIQHVRYYDKSQDMVHERRQMALVVKGEVKPGHIGFWREEMEVPPLPPSGLKGCRLIDLWYTLKFTVVTFRFAESLETNTDITIGTVGPAAESVSPPASPHGVPDASFHTHLGSSASISPLTTDSTGELDLNYFG